MGDLLARGVEALGDLLGPTWDVRVVSTPQEAAGAGGRRLDALLEVHPEGGSVFAQLLIDLKSQVTPKVIEQQLLPKLDLVRQVTPHTHLVVMAPWLSPRSQEILRDRGIGYLDLTGNVFLRIPRPAIVISTEGDRRAPRSEQPRSGKPTLAGPKAGRLVRLLADIAPPYRAGEVAAAARLSLPYVSRLLDALEEQLLIRREGRVIVDVDWVGLLRLRAGHLSLLRHNSYVGMLSPNGTRHLMMRLRDRERAGREPRVTLTGSYAAHAIAPLAVGGQVMLYVSADLDSTDTVADDLGLLRVDEGADVLLLRAYDEVVFERNRDVDGIRQVALSQLVLDCLSGPGRMPAEGEAVLNYMAEDERIWRASGIEHTQRVQEG
ncbi:hypothetical protein [Actinoallomurus rhizosphaericola]|uniref:hypothetical protein n=1 Tax=Actinoallomurus rhizosphaericola TaxID=2952536 RepID=UPI00209339A3|nr:hypothetical protein [Actinoallomurus rhizosphaericola]MCO5994956.1 hypothetical protein [Actinoallomurus rhizosphaericola]